MAELPKKIRRVGGHLESIRQPYGRRLLLPSEIEFCKLLDCSEDEYWEFTDKTAVYNGQRPKGYELIPDIKAGPATLPFFYTAAGGLNVAGQIALSVALTAIGYLLTPKPKPFKQGATIQGGDAIGSKRFAPQFAFNSLQELATLGDTVPLVFANQVDSVGGIRVNGQLLWSQLLSLGRLQQLKAIVMFSLGKIDVRPDFAGYAIGDLLLSTYSKSKLDLFFKSSSLGTFNRINKHDHTDAFPDGDKYSDSKVSGMELPFDDAFEDSWKVNNPPTGNTTLTGDDQVYPFSGARNPTTQAIFGAFSPMPNSSVVKLSYELHEPPKGTKDNAKRAIVVNKKKNNTFFPTLAGFTGGDVNAEDNKITYTILETNQTYVQNQEYGTFPHGIEDVVSMVRAIREETDGHISIGETFLAGDAVVACTEILNFNGQATPGTPWRSKGPNEEGIRRVYTFEVIEKATQSYTGTAGRMPFRNPNLFDSSSVGTQWLEEGSEKVEGVTIRLRQNMTHWSTVYGFPYRAPVLQKLAMATISNSRPCSLTEIGLKSKVFSHIRGTNLNSIPSATDLANYLNDGDNFQTGTIDMNITRYSFFKLQVRRLGTDDDFEDLNNAVENEHSGLFCVKGNTPEFQYNYIKIYHPGLGINPETSQFEYRFLPYPGNNVAVFFMGQEFNLLNAAVIGNKESEFKGQEEVDFAAKTSKGDEFVVCFAGRNNLILNEDDVSNTEWIKAFNTFSSSASTTEGGAVAELSMYSRVGFSGIQYGPPSPPITSRYNYDTSDPNNHNETLLSVNHNWDGGKSVAVLAFENGEQVGFGVYDKDDFDITEVRVPSYDFEKGEIKKFDSGLITTGHPDDPNSFYPPTLVGQDPVLIPIKVEPQPKIYTAGTLEATQHPMDVANNDPNPTPVEFYRINDRNPSISLSVGTIHLAGS